MAVPSRRWTLYVAVSKFLCAVVLLSALGPVTTTLGTLLSLPPGSAVAVLSAPVPGVGAVVWWGLVEQGGAYTYGRGAASGALTSLLTALVWLLVLAAVWTVTLVVTGAVVVGFVVAVVVPVGSLVGAASMYFRRELGGRPTAGNDSGSPERT